MYQLFSDFSDFSPYAFSPFLSLTRHLVIELRVTAYCQAQVREVPRCLAFKVLPKTVLPHARQPLIALTKFHSLILSLLTFSSQHSYTMQITSFFLV